MMRHTHVYEFAGAFFVPLKPTQQLALVHAALEPASSAIPVIQFCTYRNLSLRLLSISVTAGQLAPFEIQPGRRKHASDRVADDVHLTGERLCERLL